MLLARFFRMIRQHIYSLTSMVPVDATRDRAQAVLRWNRVPGSASEPHCIDVTA